MGFLNWQLAVTKSIAGRSGMGNVVALLNFISTIIIHGESSWIGPAARTEQLSSMDSRELAKASDRRRCKIFYGQNQFSTEYDDHGVMVAIIKSIEDDHTKLIKKLCVDLMWLGTYSGGGWTKEFSGDRTSVRLRSGKSRCWESDAQICDTRCQVGLSYWRFSTSFASMHWGMGLARSRHL